MRSGQGLDIYFEVKSKGFSLTLVVRHEGDKKEWSMVTRFGVQTTTKMKLAFTE